MLLLNSGAIFIGPLKSCIFCLDSLKVPSTRDSTRRWTDLHFYLRRNLQRLRWLVASIKLHKKWWSPSKILFYITRIHINPNHPVVLLANNFFRRCALQNLEVNLQIWAKWPSRFFPNKNLSFWPCSQHVVATCFLGQVTARRSLMKVMSCPGRLMDGWWWVRSDVSWYCWCFRNPKANHLGRIKPCK